MAKVREIFRWLLRDTDFGEYSDPEIFTPKMVLDGIITWEEMESVRRCRGVTDRQSELFLNILPRKPPKVVQAVPDILKRESYEQAATSLYLSIPPGTEDNTVLKPVPLLQPLEEDPDSRNIPILNKEDVSIDRSSGGLLGEGAFGEVRLATWKGRQVAVKIYKLDRLNEGTLQEAKIMRKLDHINVLKVYGLVADKTYGKLIFFQVMEYIKPTLINNKKDATMGRFCYPAVPQSIALEAKSRIAIACWSGLTYTHEKGVFHKDIKPGNILISQNLDEVKIADFGLASLWDILYQYTSKTEGGTFAYKSPESLKRKRMIPEKWDVYGMGLSLIELFAGARFWYHETEIREILEDKTSKRMQGLPIWRNQNLINLPPRLLAVLKSSINWNHHQRPKAKELLQQMKQFQ